MALMTSMDTVTLGRLRELRSTKAGSSSTHGLMNLSREMAVPSKMKELHAGIHNRGGQGQRQLALLLRCCPVYTKPIGRRSLRRTRNWAPGP